MTPAPTGRTGDGYPGRGVPPRPDRPQGPPRSREVPRPRPPQDPRQGSPAWSRGRRGTTTPTPTTPATLRLSPRPSSSTRRRPRAAIRAPAGRVIPVIPAIRAISRARSTRRTAGSPATDSSRRASSSPATGSTRRAISRARVSSAWTAPPRTSAPWTRRTFRAARAAGCLKTLRISGRPVAGARPRGAEYSVEYSPGLDQDQFSAGYQDGYGEDDAHDDDSRGVRRARGPRAPARRCPPQGPAQPGAAPPPQDHLPPAPASSPSSSS